MGRGERYHSAGLGRAAVPVIPAVEVEGDVVDFVGAPGQAEAPGPTAHPGAYLSEVGRNALCSPVDAFRMAAAAIELVEGAAATGVGALGVATRERGNRKLSEKY